MRRAFTVATLAIAFVSPTSGRAQQIQSFADLPLRINRDDRVRVVDPSGTRTTGRVVSFGREGLTLATDGGDRLFTSESVRQVDVNGKSTRRGAWIGAGLFAAMGAIACANNEKGGCAAWPVLDALFFGMPLGMLVGSGIPTMRPIYKASAGQAPASAPRSAATAPSLRETLGMRVNLDDRLRIESSADATVKGLLRGLTDDYLLLGQDGAETQVMRQSIRKVSITRGHARLGTLVGFLVGAASDFSGSCTGDETAECADAIIMLGGLGAGAGAIIGAMIHTSTVVYPEHAARLSLAPALVGQRAGVRLSYRF